MRLLPWQWLIAAHIAHSILLPQVGGDIAKPLPKTHYSPPLSLSVSQSSNHQQHRKDAVVPGPSRYKDSDALDHAGRWWPTQLPGSLAALWPAAAAYHLRC